MKPYILSRLAANDLVEIWDYIARDNIDVADRVVGEFDEAMCSLAQTPGMGHLREDLATEPLRFWPIYRYLIIYRAEATPLEIVRVLHGARDVASILQDPQ